MASQILATPGISAERGSFTFYGSSEINASAEEVWEVTSDFSTYAKWNTWTPLITNEDGSEASVTAEADKWYMLHYRLSPDSKTSSMRMKMVSFDAEKKTLCWQGRFMPLFLLEAEKVQKVTSVQSDDGSVRSRYEIWETQAGLLAPMVKHTQLAKLQRMNQGIATDLKQYIENGQQSVMQ